MVEIGSKIKARVVRVEPHGIWLKYQDQDVVVLAPDSSWKTDAAGAAFHAGDTIEVLAVRYNYPERVLVASVKALHPEENPYRRLARLEPGETLHGKVTALFDDEIRVDFPDGTWGKI